MMFLSDNCCELPQPNRYFYVNYANYSQKFIICVPQKLKTRVVKKNVNPEWNDFLTLAVSEPNTPIKLVSVVSPNIPDFV